jgi:hypothetical protein
MTDALATALLARLDAAEARLRTLSTASYPSGATDPEPAPDGEASWGADKVWGHLSEFPAYWTAAARTVIAAPPDAPATFGRRITDASRMDPIDGAAQVPVPELFARCAAGIADARAFLGTVQTADWERVGLHVTRGETPVRRILEGLLVDHLEEHAAQLERLAAS